MLDLRTNHQYSCLWFKTVCGPETAPDAPCRQRLLSRAVDGGVGRGDVACRLATHYGISLYVGFSIELSILSRHLSRHCSSMVVLMVVLVVAMWHVDLPHIMVSHYMLASR